MKNNVALLLLAIIGSFGSKLTHDHFTTPVKRAQSHVIPLLETLSHATYMQPNPIATWKGQQVAQQVRNPVIYPTDFGADPTGKQDSTNAFQQAIQTLLKRDSGHRLADNIVDLGGATIDLAGGDYLVNAPLAVPENYGNFRIQRGTLRASSSFPQDGYIISVGGECHNGQGSCNQNVGIEDLMLDCQHYAAGGLHILNTMGANVGPQMFVLGFNTAGITVSGGHEIMIHETWLGEFLYSDPRSQNPKATAIQLLGNDHYITNTIVFSSRIGVEITGAANVLTGVHTWNLAEKLGGIGIYMPTPAYTQNRILGCYLDYNSVVVVAPEHLTISDTFFLCGANIVLKAVPQHTTINGLNIIGNQWDDCGNDTIVLDQTQAKFTAIYDTVVRDNMMNQMTLRSSQAEAKIKAQNTTMFSYDFTDKLLFPWINKVTYSIELEEGVFARHASRPPNGLRVNVETDIKVSGTVRIFVDQNQASP